MASRSDRHGMTGDLEHFERVARWIDAYYADPYRFAVLSRSAPGDLRAALPADAPDEGEPFERIFADFERLIVPGITHWNHPRFFAYFSITGSEPAVLAELLAAALNVNAMLWRTSPAATEIEEVALKWLRDALGLPPRIGQSLTPGSPTPTARRASISRCPLVACSGRRT